MKIYTRSGDAGTTGLFAGPRVFKDDVRIEAYGTVDELNAYLGVILANMDQHVAKIEVNSSNLFEVIQQIQSDLFCIGAELATPDPDGQAMRLFQLAHIELLENAIDSVETELPKLTNFILPGGNPSAAQLHFARTVCRRAERQIVSLARTEGVADYSQVIIFLNRLGDLLFVLARLVNHKQGCRELVWHKPA